MNQDYPCDGCMYDPPSSGDGKPCCNCFEGECKNEIQSGCFLAGEPEPDPCKYCGSEPVFDRMRFESGGPERVRVRCSNPDCRCDLGGWRFSSVSEALKAWNRTV